MKLSVTTRGGAIEHSQTLREYLTRRAELALDRQVDRVTSLTAVFEDLNGPRGGIDKRCRITVRGPELGELVVEQTDREWSSGIDGAIATMSRNIVRQLERRRGSTRPSSHNPSLENT
jgi:putative sigma-54 modulation protein